MSPDEGKTPAADVNRALRCQIITKRRKLPVSKVISNSSAVCAMVTKTHIFRNAQTVGVYMALNGEIDPGGIIAASWNRKKKVFLPVIRNFDNKMRFALITENSALGANRFGILEPDIKKFTPSYALDLVIIPLVGFDRRGNRIGMGQGFYDRTFGFVFTRGKAPVLIGLGHSFQEADNLIPNDWDVPLDIIVTEQEMITC